MSDGRPLARVSALPFGVGLERSRLHLVVAVGDALAASLLIFAGVLHHYVADPGSPLDALGTLPPLGHVVAVIAPFLVGWVIASVLSGAYTRTALASPLTAVVNGVGTWVLAALIGSALRATPVLPGGSPPTFVAVVVGTGAVAFAVWRGLVAYVVAAD